MAICKSKKGLNSKFAGTCTVHFRKPRTNLKKTLSVTNRLPPHHPKGHCRSSQSLAGFLVGCRARKNFFCKGYRLPYIFTFLNIHLPIEAFLLADRCSMIGLPAHGFTLFCPCAHSRLVIAIFKRFFLFLTGQASSQLVARLAEFVSRI